MNEYLNKVTNPSQPVNRGTAAGFPQPTGPQKSKKLKSRVNLARLGFVLFFAVLAIIIAGITVLVMRSGGTPTVSKINHSEYQAVFLNSSDGQVYFGRLSSMNKDYYLLTDIYYVRVQQVQPNNSTTTTSSSNISLAKLGNEIHGPEDAMYINKNNVMFWENLKETGQVVKAIRQYQKNISSGTTTTTPETTTTTK